MPKRSSKCGKGGRKNKSKKQKLYNMKGCSKSVKMTKSASKRRTLKGGQGCGVYGCPIAPYSWKQMQQGGSCDSCGLSPMTGGSFYKPPAPIPGPFVGQAWSPSIADWPGVNGVGGDSNYLANNLYKGPDPQTMMKLGGSRKGKGKKNCKKKGLRGGGIIPQDLVNLGRDMSFNFKSAYNALNGYPAPVNSLPYKDQLSSSISANRIII
jgi:hypothetical protein